MANEPNRDAEETVVHKGASPAPGEQRSTIARVAEDHPFALLAGGIVIGIVAANVIPASRLRRWGKNAWSVAALASELGLSLGARAADNVTEASRAGREQVGEWTATMVEGSEDARRFTGEMVGHATDSARETGAAFYRQLLDWGQRIRK